MNREELLTEIMRLLEEASMEKLRVVYQFLVHLL